MDVAIGLPNAVPDTDGSVRADWAQRAEEGGFSSLGTIFVPCSNDPGQVGLLAEAVRG